MSKKKEDIGVKLSAYRASLNRAKNPGQVTTQQDLNDHCKAGGVFIVKPPPGQSYLKADGKVYPIHSEIMLESDSPILRPEYVELPQKMDDHQRRHHALDYHRDVFEPLMSNYSAVVNKEQRAIAAYAIAQTRMRDAATALQDAQEERAAFEAGPVAEALENAPLMK